MICYNRINSIFTTVYTPLNKAPANLIHQYGYKILVRLFGLLDVESLNKTGIERLRTILNFDLRVIEGNISHMDGIDVKNLLLRGARRDRNISYPNQDWGYGILDIISTFESLRGG